MQVNKYVDIFKAKLEENPKLLQEKIKQYFKVSLQSHNLFKTFIFK